MSTTETTARERAPLWASPGLIVAILFSLLVLMIAIGVVVTNRGSDPIENVTIAELRADPDGFDMRTVTLTGTAEEVRQLPVLDQYALYTFRDETGEMWALSQQGAPPSDGERVELTAIFHSRITLDEQIRTLVEAQFGSLAGSLVGGVLPGIGVNAVFLEHDSYELVSTNLD